MKRLTSTLAILALVGASAPTLAGDADDAVGGAVATRNCFWCHGSSAQGFATAPRLAGQQPQYLENQLLSFRFHARDNPLSKLYMWGASANLDPLIARKLAIYLSSLPARPAEDGRGGPSPRGEEIYRDGIPDANIPACVACHGPNAEGFAGIPRVGGLSYFYLKRRLEQWGEGFHAAAWAPMPEVASKLSADEIEDLSSYLSFLR
jgi:cytochrome c553